MKRTAVVVSLALLLSGCTLQDVNELSPIKYRYRDDAGQIILKTAGNLVPWTLEAAAVMTGIGIVLGLAYVSASSPSKTSNSSTTSP